MAKRQANHRDDSALQVRLGVVLKTCRHELGITQEELAWRADMHRTYIADIERGVRNVTLRSLCSLSAALQVPVETLFARANEIGATNNRGRRAGAVGEILLIEDNAADAEMTLRAFRRANLANPVKVVSDGQEALDYLFGSKVYPKPATPQLVLLDLNLPKISGIEVLRQIKSHPRTRTLPVVVLTVSRHDRDIIACGQLGAENYIIKPVSFDGLCQVTPKLSFHWALLRPRITSKLKSH